MTFTMGSIYVGTLLNKILMDMKSKVEDGQTDDSKLFLYSGVSVYIEF